MMKWLNILLIAFTVSLLAGCSGCNKNKCREKPDVSNIRINLQLLRFDQDLANFHGHNFTEWQQEMREKYGDFYDFYLSNFIVGPRPAGDTSDIAQEAISKYLEDHYIKSIQDSISSRYKDTRQLEEELTELFRNIKAYFPEFQVPQIITINSAYGAGVSPFGNDKMVIGLDMFLGADNKDYDSAGVYQYLRHKMTPAFIPRYAALALYQNNFAPLNVPADQPLVEALVEKGKENYFVACMLPCAPDSFILGYTQTQTNWCKNSEYEIWQFMNDKDLLYKTSGMDKTRYLGDGPTTAGMPAEAPGAVGGFTGWQIVNKFMKDQGDKVSLKELITQSPASVLNKARYHPSR